MGEAEFCSVEKISVRLIEFPDELFVAALAVHIVPHHRISHRTQVHADLVRASCFDFHLQERELTEFFHRPILGVRRTASALDGRHFRANLWMPAY